MGALSPRLLLAVVAVAALCACGPALPEPTPDLSRDPDLLALEREPIAPTGARELAREPLPAGADRLTASGWAADGRAQAREAALAEMARVLGSRIEAEVRHITDVTEGSESHTVRRYLQDVRITARFDHAELVREVAYNPPSEAAPHHEVVVALSRGAAERALRADAAPLADRFAVAAERARAALASGDREGAALAWNELKDVAVPLDAIDLQRRVLLGAPIPEQDERLATVREILVAAARVRDDTLAVVVAGAASAEPAAAAVAARLGELGVRVRRRTGGDACAVALQRSRAIAFELSLVSDTCRRGSLGQHCAAEALLVARPCVGQGQLFQLTARGKGIHPSDAARATEKARSALGGPLAEQLEGALAPHVPLP